MIKLFSPSKIKNVTIPNRIVMSPMCQYSATTNGEVTDWHRVHYGARAIAKVGLIILEASGVEARGRISDYDLGIWGDHQISGLKEIVNFAHLQGSAIGIQLAHAGRKATISDKDAVIAPSPIPFDEGFVTPKEMSKEIIVEVVQAFAQGAKRANEAGFDIIELHGAHGYLIHEFLSPLSNKRTDEYGGSRENRLRFLKEVIEAVKQEWPAAKPIFLRVSATDYHEDGIDIHEMVAMMKYAKDWGIDVIDVSSGALLPVKINVGPGYQIRFSEQIKHEVGIPTMTVGLITEAEQAEEILFNDRADYIALGRELLRNPQWPLYAAAKLKEDVEWPEQYNRAKI